MRKKPFAILQVLALCALVCACETTGHAPSAAASYAAPTKAQARAFARAVNLTSADLHGFKATPPEHERQSTAEKRLEREMLRCARSSPTKGIVELPSKEFQRESEAGTIDVQSEVTVQSSPSVAAKKLAVMRSSRTRNCLSHYMNLLLHSKKFRGASIGPLSVTAVTPPASHIDGAFEWRASVTITVRGVRLPLYLSILGFIDGPAEVSLFTSSFPMPYGAANEDRLFSLLQRRAKANRLA